MRSTPGRALAPAAAAAAAAPAARRRSTARAAMPPAAARTALDEHAPDGAFAREAAVFRHSIEPGGRFPPAAGRYHLYISHACPWANRAHAVLRLKGLEGAVGVSVVHPTWQRTRPGDPADGHAGWAFRAPGDAPVTPLAGRGAVPCDGCVPDPLENAKFVRDLYEIAGDTGGKFTVPVLWDAQARAIVNNESADIVRILNSGLDEFAANPGVDLYPPARRAEIDAVNAWVYDGINDGVYKCGFAKSQAAYDAASAALLAALERAEALLARRRFLVGDALTEADVRLFVTLIRFDPVYVAYFKCDMRAIREFPALRGYTADLFQTPGIRESVNVDHIRRHYWTSHPVLGPHAIISRGPAERWWEAPHGRGALGGAGAAGARAGGAA